MFEYRCKKCGRVTEFLESAGAEGKHRCQECGSTSMVKLLSTFGVKVASGSSQEPVCASCPTGTCPFS